MIDNCIRKQFTGSITADVLSRPQAPLGQSIRRFLSFSVLLCVAMLIAACGPGTAKSSGDELTGRTVQVALDFQADNDLESARAAIDVLEVANPRQWVVMVTETTIGAEPDSVEANALVGLTQALGIESSTIRQYAETRGLVEATEVIVPTVAVDVPSLVATQEPAALAQGGASADAPLVETTPAPMSAALPTPTEEGGVALALPSPTPTALDGPRAKASGLINVRGGPGTDYAAVAVLSEDDLVKILAQNPAGDWWQIELADGSAGWVLGQLVEVQGDSGQVAVASDIPDPPTPSAVVEPAATEETIAAAAAATESPQDEIAADATPSEAPTASPNDQPYFRLVARRMWSKQENGDCRGQHLLRIHVVDANGIRINGVRLKGIYTGIELVTGDQGKGDGVIEYDLYGPGEGFRVIRNDDGREASSDNAEGFTTLSLDIDKETLIAGGYCSDSADCDIFYYSYGCSGHHSWEATFQRNY